MPKRWKEWIFAKEFLRNSPKASRRGHRRIGFTLVELMVATSVGSMVVVVTVALASRQRSFHEAHRQISDVQQNTGYLIDCVSRDIRMAGYGLNVPLQEMEDWITWETEFSSNPKVLQGASDLPDKLFIAAAFDAPLAELATGITTGATSITVNYIGRGNPPFDTQENRILFLGKTETIRIVGITGNSGNQLTLTISTDPVYNAEGVHFDYPAGSPIEMVSVVQYSWNNGQGGTGYPYISRNDSADRLSYGGLWEVSAENIEDFQVSEATNVYTVAATGMTAKRDKDFIHASEGDHLRRRSYQALVRPRN